MVKLKVKVRWMKTVDTVHNTLYLFKLINKISKFIFIKISKSKSYQKSVFSEELQWAKLKESYNQKIWKLSLLRRRSTSKSFHIGFLSGNQTIQRWMVQNKQAKSDRAKESICNPWSRPKSVGKKKGGDSME